MWILGESLRGLWFFTIATTGSPFRRKDVTRAKYGHFSGNLVRQEQAPGPGMCLYLTSVLEGEREGGDSRGPCHGPPRGSCSVCHSKTARPKFKLQHGNFTKCTYFTETFENLNFKRLCLFPAKERATAMAAGKLPVVVR